MQLFIFNIPTYCCMSKVGIQLSVFCFVISLEWLAIRLGNSLDCASCSRENICQSCFLKMMITTTTAQQTFWPWMFVFVNETICYFDFCLPFVGLFLGEAVYFFWIITVKRYHGYNVCFFLLQMNMLVKQTMQGVTCLLVKLQFCEEEKKKDFTDTE